MRDVEGHPEVVLRKFHQFQVGTFEVDEDNGKQVPENEDEFDDFNIAADIVASI